MSERGAVWCPQARMPLPGRMLPIQPSAIPAAKVPAAATARKRQTWREALDELGWFLLIVNLAWAAAIVVYVVLR